MRALFRSETTCRHGLQVRLLLAVWITLVVHFSAADSDTTNRGVNDDIRAPRSDDVSLQSLHGVVEQLSTLTQSLQAQLLAEKSRAAEAEDALKTQLATAQQSITDLGVKVGQLSKQVAFTVRFRHDDTIHGIAVANKSPLRFDDVVLNAGGGYNVNTGIFTAPVSGLYSFFVNVMGASLMGSVAVSVEKEGGTIDLVYAHDHDEQGSSMVTTHVAQGQQVWVRHVGGAAVRGAWYTVFTGYLVQSDTN